jgi:hypothetical protein
VQQTAGSMRHEGDEHTAKQVGEPVIVWRQTDGEGLCRTACIGDEGVTFGPCEGVQLGGIFGQPDRRCWPSGLAWWRLKLKPGAAAPRGDWRSPDIAKTKEQRARQVATT